MASTFSLLLLSILTLLHRPPISEPASLFAADTLPTAFFEVTKPITLPKTKPFSYLVLKHDVAYTYGKSPVLADYKPPSHRPSQNFAKIVFEWTATCKGRQFDRIFGVWLGGVEILRSSTAEPRATGIIWTVKKDITRYYSLLMNNQTLAVYLGNIVDTTYTAAYHVNIIFHFYPAEVSYGKHSEVKSGELETGADLILPISRSLPLNDGLWFEIRNSTDIKTKESKIPQNAYRAVLEVYVSFHEDDEFWYGNYPDEYISANNLTGAAGNGPFREVTVGLDNLAIGAVWPFTVIYTGGVPPLMWRPITGIGSFDLPSYNIDITSFLGKILDGKSHEFAFSVRNALNVWYIDANLHLWLDNKSEKTEGKLLEYGNSDLSLSHLSNFTGYDGFFITNKPSSPIRSIGSRNKFILSLYSDDIDKGNGTYESVANVTLGFNEKRRLISGSGIFTSKLKNLQNAHGNMLVKGNLVVSGLGSTQQEYRYISGTSCYSRNVSSSNYTIIHDEETNVCG
ncbi:hypothetical protein OROGR_015285 [Orobanche gracilis]